MNLAEAIAAIQSGHRVRSSGGTLFWLSTSPKGYPVLMGQPRAMDHPIKNVVLSSEHFHEGLVWTIEQ